MGPGRLREVIFGGIFGDMFGGILGAQAEKLKIMIIQVFFVCLGPFSVQFIVLCCLPCCVAGGAAHMQKS